MLGKYNESPEGARNRSNPVVMSMMPPPPLYPSSSAAPPSASSTNPRRPNESTGSSTTTVVNIVTSSPTETAAIIAAATGAPTSPETTVKQLTPQYQCQICLKCFNSVGTLSVHLNTHENTTQIEYRNTYNGQVVTGTSPIKTEPQPFQMLASPNYAGGVQGFQMAVGTGLACQICQKVFNNSDQYQSHMKIHENEFRNRALYQAGSSGQQVPTVVVKEPEQSDEVDGKPIDCIVCHKKFQTATQLAVHLREHSSEKPYR